MPETHTHKHDGTCFGESAMPICGEPETVSYTANPKPSCELHRKFLPCRNCEKAKKAGPKCWCAGTFHCQKCGCDKDCTCPIKPSEGFGEHWEEKLRHAVRQGYENIAVQLVRDLHSRWQSKAREIRDEATQRMVERVDKAEPRMEPFAGGGHMCRCHSIAAAQAALINEESVNL